MSGLSHELEVLDRITPTLEAELIRAAGQARCERDQRGAALVTTSRGFDGSPAGTVRALGWNGLPAGLGCTLRMCSPGNEVGGCKATAEHAEAMAIRNCVGGLPVRFPKGMDMVHAKIADGAIAVSRPPTEKACLRCAVMMVAWGIAGIWLFVEPGEWRRFKIDEYWRGATKVAGVP